jgi:hypothetical protein
MNKKAVEIWISWILLVALAVATSVFMYSWFTGTTETAVESIQLVYDSSECQSVSVSAEACSQAQTLYINVTNKLLLNVDGLMFRIHYSDLSSELTNMTVRISPGEKKDYTAKLNVSKTFESIDVVPIIQTGKFSVVCTAKRTSIDTVSSC